MKHIFRSPMALLLVLPAGLVLGSLLSGTAQAKPTLGEPAPVPRPEPKPTPGGDDSIAKLRRALASAGVVHFSAEELLRIRYPSIAKRVGYTGKTFPATSSEIAALVKVAQKAELLRAAYGGPLTVLNGLRPREYNDLVSESKGSKHITGQALDLTASDMPRLRAALWKMVQDGQVNGAGFYAGNVHMDTRGTRTLWGSKLEEVKALG